MHNTATVLALATSTADSPETPPDRDELVRQALPLVKAIAERLRRRYTLTASFDELCAIGMTGLAVAVDRFDPSRGASFVTFAYHKIRGAILDGPLLPQPPLWGSFALAG
jgi:RNA polymerase sigma factor for flagellar operon FliA